MKKELAPHQQRVVREADDLRERVDRLREFILGPRFLQVMRFEQERLSRQLAFMRAYLEVLEERINNF